MKKTTTILLFFLLTNQAFAQANISGGWVEYRHVVDNPLFNLSIYSVTFHLYGSGVGLAIKIYDVANGEAVKSIDLEDPVTYSYTLSNHFSACANTNALNNKYQITDVTYILRFPISSKSYLVCLSGRGRDANLVNIYDPQHTGILCSTTIIGTAGTRNNTDYHTNSSPIIEFTDTLSVCKNMPFVLPIKASDPEGDSLSYRFGDAVDAPYDTTSPPLLPVQYNPPFSGAEPMGSGVTINPVTGIISGVATNMVGYYNITVYIDEWRNGRLLNTTRKEFQVKVTNCPFAKPLLKPLYSGCRRYTYTFSNEPTCPNITSWFWDFGVPNSTTDTSSLAAPTFTYPSVPGTYTLKLRIANDYGYIDSATSVVKIYDSITVKLNADTAICKTDTITLQPISNATSYVWTEIGGTKTLSSYIIKNPKALPTATITIYKVKGNLDLCKDSATITVYASPYPKVNAGRDTIICYGERAYLNATATATFFRWSPINSLYNSNSLQPIAYSSKTTTYVLTVNDTFYCPKLVRDTVVVKVVPMFKVDAGKDESVVIGQHYQFNAKAIGNTEIVTYAWQPANYFINKNVPDAIAVIDANMPEITSFKVTATTIVGGCTATDDVLLKVFKIGPDILVPTAFTPNNDGNNDVLKPILIGINKLNYFTIYNRWGQIMYNTKDASAGWDGNKNGLQQPIGNYVFTAEGIDYTGKIISKKGTVVLIR